MKKTRSYFLVSMLGALVLLSACGSSADKKKPEADRPVESLYNQAADALDRGDYNESARLFEEVERQHPYSQWATQAEMMAAYSYYKKTRYDEAILALDRFLELHPGNPNSDYALYLKALCFYEQITDVARDQMMTEMALESLDALISRYPDSRYARDAAFKRDLTLDHLAGKEMEIGRYYLKSGQTNAAMNRFLAVVKNYQTTTHVPEALHRLVEIYMTLGLQGEATRVAAVLGHNYPGSPWYEDSFKLLTPELRQQVMEDRSWVDKTVDSLFKSE
ncbi:MAG: outer membrane protein assembly factor BamD [Micavibrio aeruginosavorus]|uniref:Outer membrane protein assembly factor BamD n=1 Tax=Micavibrio aeruginosavorus TaxID=349221 RepID=A0A7T5R201_9BACT|nr:MAG: outer membrane protein assembly factor BamD [Micavibrio aeruginosavorus]